MLSQKNALILSGFAAAKVMTRQCAKSFYFASRFLPKEKKNAAFVIYAICKISDEAVDTCQGLSASNQIAQVKESINSAYNANHPDNSLLLAFKETVDKYAIPRAYFDAFIQGMYMDLDKNRYENFQELYGYCYRAGGIIGPIMLKVFGYEDAQAEKFAIDLGVAMQLTNIIRDVREDFQRGRIYLPQDEMRKFGVSEDDIAKGRLTANFKDLLRFQIQRSRQYYVQAQQGVKMINSFSCRFVVLAMKDLYRGILDGVERNGYDVFSKRAYVTDAGFFFTVLKILFTAQYL